MPKFVIERELAGAGIFRQNDLLDAGNRYHISTKGELPQVGQIYLHDLL